uniref:Cysteine rich secreted protein n=1 Tax=Riptortus pedestris TaxID=329032 RepID=R4WE54_RIPPE|nr:cysteine rich secreted protein [Riptortus pedestris]
MRVFLLISVLFCSFILATPTPFEGRDGGRCKTILDCSPNFFCCQGSNTCCPKGTMCCKWWNTRCCEIY